MPAICLAKLTTLVYLHELSPERCFEVINTMLEVFIILWSLAAEFAIAFPCQLPSPWATITGKCYNQVCLHFHVLICDGWWSVGCVLESQWKFRHPDGHHDRLASTVPRLVPSHAQEKEECGCYGIRMSTFVRDTFPLVQSSLLCSTF